MSKQGHSGYPCVSNPHDFDPDPECCTPKEIEAHRQAKADWAKPAFTPNVGCAPLIAQDGAVVGHVTRTSWGIGVNFLDFCDGCSQPVFSDPLIYCHECARDMCERCWPEHEKQHDEGAS